MYKVDKTSISHLYLSASLVFLISRNAAAADHWAGWSHQLLLVLLSASHRLTPYWQSLAAAAAAAACLYPAAAYCLLNSAGPCLNSAAANWQSSVAVQLLLHSAADHFAWICLGLPLSAASAAAAFQHCCCSVQGRPALAKEEFIDQRNSQHSSLSRMNKRMKGAFAIMLYLQT